MKKILQAILGVFGYQVLTKKEYRDLKPIQPIHPTQPETLLTYKEVVEMLRTYDATRLKQITELLGFEETRINTFEFGELKNYMRYVEKLAKEKGIKLKGISFIKGVYTEATKHNDDFVDYENLMYMPTAMVNGKEVLIDVVNSSEGKIVTFKEMLAKYDYIWRYDNKKNFVLKKEKQQVQQQQVLKSVVMRHDHEGGELSGTGNFGTYTPPYPTL